MTKKAILILGICAAVLCIVFAAGCVDSSQTPAPTQEPTTAPTTEPTVEPTLITNPDDLPSKIIPVIDPILGKWVCNIDTENEYLGTLHSSITLEFFSDGKMSMTIELFGESGEPVYGLWEKVGVNQYTTYFDETKEEHGEIFSITNGDTIIIDNGDGEPSVYHRVN